MTANGFPAAYERVRVYEGGNVDDPRDPGGRTSRGVTQRVYDAWRSRQGKPKRDVYLATDAEVKAIYRAQYWDAIRGDDLPAGVDMVVFDGAVNSGPKQSIKWLQRGLGIKADGVLGSVTLDAIADDTDNDLLIQRISERRMGFLRSLSTWKHYGKGWSLRVANLTKAGQAVAMGTIGPKPIKVAQDGGNAKASEDDIAKPLVSAGNATGMTSVGVGLSAANEVVKEATPQVQAIADVSDVLRYLFVALVIIGLGLTAYAVWRNSRARKAVRADSDADVMWDADEVAA